MEWNWEKFYDRAYAWIIETGPKVLAAIFVLLIGLWLIRMFNRFVKRAMKKKKFNPSLSYFLQNLIAITLQILLVLMVMQVAGIQLTFFAAIVAGLSVAAGLALSGTLQNFVSGILILLLRPFRVGDIISTQGQEGTVSAIQLFYTTVNTYDNKVITIPNGQLSNNVIINLSREGKRRMDIELKVGYGIDFEPLKKILSESIKESPNTLDDPEFRIGVITLEPDKYSVMINVWTKAHGFIDSKMELQERLIRDMKRAGVKLPGM